MKSLIQDKRGGYVDIFIFMVVALIIVVIGVVFIYLGTEVETQLHDTLDDFTEDNSSANYTRAIDTSFDDVNYAYSIMRWLAIFLILGMIVAIIIGSYMVTTKPVFFVPYIIIMLIAIVVSVGISNGYELMMENATLNPTFNQFVGTNFIILNLPIWVAVVGITGGIIMFIKMQRGEEYYGY